MVKVQFFRALFPALRYIPPVGGDATAIRSAGEDLGKQAMSLSSIRWISLNIWARRYGQCTVDWKFMMINSDGGIAQFVIVLCGCDKPIYVHG